MLNPQVNHNLSTLVGIIAEKILCQKKILKNPTSKTY